MQRQVETEKSAEMDVIPDFTFPLSWHFWNMGMHIFLRNEVCEKVGKLVSRSCGQLRQPWHWPYSRHSRQKYSRHSWQKYSRHSWNSRISWHSWNSQNAENLHNTGSIYWTRLSFRSVTQISFEGPETETQRKFGTREHRKITLECNKMYRNADAKARLRNAGCEGISGTPAYLWKKWLMQRQ